MGLLDGKHLVISGVLTDASLAYAVAELALTEGAEIILTGAGRGRSLTTRMARRLGDGIDVLSFDATDSADIEALTGELSSRWDRVDGVLHAIGFAPEACLGDSVMTASWEDVSTALQVSTYSLKGLTQAVAPLMTSGGAIVGLDFDASVAWPDYNWMGVAKAGLESLTRYLARDLGPVGIRVNLIAAGPIRTMAATSIPGFDSFESAWNERAPLGWDVTDRVGVARAAVALLSDWFPQTTGSIIHVDGGYHAIGA